jgi:hypothetical protein
MNRILPTLHAIARRRALLLAFAVAASGAAVAASADDTERSRIAEERAAIESRYAARERECRDRFVVTSCVDDAKRDRRRGLDALRSRQIKLDEAKRRERSAERGAELAGKAAEDARREQERAARSASAPARREAPRPLEPRHDRPAGPTGAASAALGHDRPAAIGDGLGLKPGGRESAAQRREREARHRDSFETRQRQAAEHRDEVMEKAAQRLKEHRPAAPLPVPASVPAQ